MDEQEVQRILQTIMDQQSRGIPLTAEQLKQLKEATSELANFKKGLVSAAKDVTKGFTETSKALAGGNRDLSTMSGALRGFSDAVDKAVAPLMVSMPVFGAALGGANQALKAATASLGLMQTRLDGYREIGRIGAQGAQGLSTLQQQFVRSRLSVTRFTDIMSKNSVALARMGGSTALGAEKLTDVFEGLTTDRGLMRLGMMPEQIAEMTSEFMAQQTRLGFTQTLQAGQLRQATKEYLIELNSLASLTGQNVDELQAQRNALLAETRFRAKYQQMMASGDEQQIEAAKQMMSYVMSLPPELATGVKDLFTAGTATTVEGQRAMLMGLDKPIQGIVSGQTDYVTALRESQVATKGFTDQYGELMAALGDAGGGGLFKGGAELYDFQTRTIEDLDKIRARQLAIVEGGDAITNKGVEAVARVAELASNIDSLINKFAGEIFSTATFAAGTVNLMTDMVNTATSASSYKPPTAEESEEARKRIAELERQGIVIPGSNMLPTSPVPGLAEGGPVDAKKPYVPGLAEGGPVDAKKPYVVGEKGPELFVPKMSGDIIPAYTGPVTSEAMTMDPRKYLSTLDWNEQYREVLKYGSRLGDTGNQTIVVTDPEYRKDAYANFAKEQGAYAETMGPMLASRKAKGNLVEMQLQEELLSDEPTATGGTGAGSDAVLMKEQNAKLDELINLQKKSVNTQGKMLSASYS